MGILPNTRAWRLLNEDTFEEVEGDFEAVALTDNVSATYGDSFALNSDLPITQFLHGNVDTISFAARLFDDSITPQGIITNLKFTLAKEKLEKLKQWVKKNEQLSRPPVLVFSAGSGEVSMRCILPSLTSIYDDLTFSGNIRGASLTINLRRFVPFDIEAAATAPPETRYHRVRAGDYYELIAQREYRRPLLGDVIRDRHPDQRVLSEADIVRLPSFAAIRSERVVPRSVQLKTLSVSKISPQGTLRQEHLDRLNRSFVSHVIPEGL